MDNKLISIDALNIDDYFVFKNDDKQSLTIYKKLRDKKFTDGITTYDLDDKEKFNPTKFFGIYTYRLLNNFSYSYF